jgi:hypothetical protein
MFFEIFFKQMQIAGIQALRTMQNLVAKIRCLDGVFIPRVGIQN